MKQLERLRLNQLSKKELNENELGILLGGLSCTCPCAYAGSGGGSSTSSNDSANTFGDINPAYVNC
jgi:natural product precursor